MKWRELSKSNAKVYYDKIMNSTQIFTIVEDSNDINIREKISKEYDKIIEELNGKNINIRSYTFDVKFGLRLYDILHNEYKMDEREASNDNIWRYLQLYLFPDIVTRRWGVLQENRIFSQSNRLYFKTLWWYIYLSYNDSMEYTEELLLKPGNSTDTIMHLTDRTSIKGYRRDLYREIMKQKSNELVKADEFKRIMKINNAKLMKMNPELSSGGIEKYVSDLIKTVREN